ncbi:MAG: tRNA pseudouridine(38-40) synthase TruA [Clostridia bacterium]|nr:tRNA pseudouridine(38-40) synthase TruA [Clostridia bacterium]
MMNIKLTICYDGTDFLGWQIQKKGRTVQEEVEKAIFSLTGERVKLVGSGRTDTGVSAMAQVANFKTESTIKPEKFSLALNTILPSDVKVLKSELVPDDFSARFSALKKTYEYKFYKSKVEIPILERFALRVNESIDVSKMQDAVEVFLGEQDFKCFLKSGSSVKNTVRTIYDAKIFEKDDCFIFSVTGNGFLYNMVRTMVGSLLLVGEGKITKETLSEIIKTGDRKRVGRTVLAKGLLLKEVVYQQNTTYCG